MIQLVAGLGVGNTTNRTPTPPAYQHPKQGGHQHAADSVLGGDRRTSAVILQQPLQLTHHHLMISITVLICQPNDYTIGLNERLAPNKA